MIVEGLTFAVVALVVALVVNDSRHRKTEMALLDRVLSASGNQPLTEVAPTYTGTSVPESLKRKLVFPVR